MHPKPLGPSLKQVVKFEIWDTAGQERYKSLASGHPVATGGMEE